jgi:hypothetical protein
MNNNQFFFIFFLCLTCFIMGCIDSNGISAGPAPGSHTSREQTPDPVTGSIIVDPASVRNLGSGSIITNVSFISGIALNDDNVKEMVRHNSTIRGIIDFMPSRPKGWNLSAGPALWVVYKEVDVYFYVNESAEYVERYEIVVPGYLYRKERAGDTTCLLDQDGNHILAYATGRIWIPEKDACL